MLRNDGRRSKRRSGDSLHSSKSLYVTGKSVQKVCGNSGQCEHWNRIPDSVLFDKELSLAARCVYAKIAGSVHQGTTAKIGQRLIANSLGIHQETVTRALAELVDRKHITIHGNGKERRLYHLHSDIFGQKQKALDAGLTVKEDLVSFPRPRLATVRSA